MALALQRVPSPALIPELLAVTRHQMVSPPLLSLALQWSKLTIRSHKLCHVSCGFRRPRSFQTLNVRLHEENQPPCLKINQELEQHNSKKTPVRNHVIYASSTNIVSSVVAGVCC